MQHIVLHLRRLQDSGVSKMENTFVLFRSDLAGYVVKQNLSICRKSLAQSFHIAEEPDPITVPGTICFV
jgi:hypothetical protein